MSSNVLCGTCVVFRLACRAMYYVVHVLSLDWPVEQYVMCYMCCLYSDLSSNVLCGTCVVSRLACQVMCYVVRRLACQAICYVVHVLSLDWHVEQCVMWYMCCL